MVVAVLCCGVPIIVDKKMDGAKYRVQKTREWERGYLPAGV